MDTDRAPLSQFALGNTFRLFMDLQHL